MSAPSLPPLIAVVGSDGSGKSTITEALQSWLAESRPTIICHLGKQSGNMGRNLARLPLFGARLEKKIHGSVQKAATGKGPGVATAAGIYAFVLRRARRFERMMTLRREGYTIIADRFPQIEVPGPMDGMQLGNARPTGLVGWLARKERRTFAAMAAQKPDLVIRLNVSLDVAIARKPDHRPASLARKIDDMSRLSFQGAPIVEIDADQPLETVLGRAKAAVADMLRKDHEVTAPTEPVSQ